MAVARWRRWNTAIHRDLGYLCAGLTIVYAVSGIAVNHTADWNPNYRVARSVVPLDGLDASSLGTPEFPKTVLRRLGLDADVRGTFRPDPNTLQIFLEGTTLTIDAATGQATWEKVTDRPGIRQANFLHLNHPKKLWTWMADAYALALALLAVTGLFILRGRKGITGRGAWLTGLGVAIPVAFIILYF